MNSIYARGLHFFYVMYAVPIYVVDVTDCASTVTSLEFILMCMIQCLVSDHADQDDQVIYFPDTL